MQEDDKRKDEGGEQTASEKAVEERPRFEERLAAGDKVTAGDAAEAQGLVTTKEAATASFAGMTLASIPLQRGVSPDGSVTDPERLGAAMEHRRRILGEVEFKPEDEAIFGTGLNTRRSAESSLGVSAEGHTDDPRRVSLVDDVERMSGTSGMTGATLFTTTSVEAPPKAEAAQEAERGEGGGEQDAAAKANESKEGLGDQPGVTPNAATAPAGRASRRSSAGPGAAAAEGAGEDTGQGQK